MNSYLSTHAARCVARLGLALMMVGPASTLQAAMYNLNVELIQVCDDAGGNCAPFVAPVEANGGDYTYAAEVNEIWDQAEVQVSYTTSQWNNTEAQQLDVSERDAIYDDNFTAGSGDSLPAVATDAFQMFFVLDHPGTGYDGTSGSGWVDNPIDEDCTDGDGCEARNAGNAQLFQVDASGDPLFSSNGRGVMANQGFTSDSLSGTLAHEIGHLMGLYHVNDGGDGVDGPILTMDIPNLMWEAGEGPGYDTGLDDNPALTTLQENYDLTQTQIDLAIESGLAFDPDGNGIGAMQVIPEPGTLLLAMFGLIGLLARRGNGS